MGKRQTYSWLGNLDPTIALANGNIAGHSIERKFGASGLLASSELGDIWDYPDAVNKQYTFTADASPAAYYISSDSASDTEDIIVVTLDGNFNEVTTTVTLQGQTKVRIGTGTYIRHNRSYNDNGVALVGNVYIYEDDTTTTPGVPDTPAKVRGYIAIGEDQTLQLVYTVPAGYTAFVAGFIPSVTTRIASAVTYTPKVRLQGKVFRTADKFGCQSAGTGLVPIVFPFVIPFPEKSDFRVLFQPSANNTAVSFSLFMYLVENTQF